MRFSYLIIFLFVFTTAHTQEPVKDSVKQDSAKAVIIAPDTAKKKRIYNPKVAATRSAILPGLGQIYNRKYWKLPIVYGALGITGGVFFYNIKNYKDLKFAYAAKYKASLAPPLRDSTDYFKIPPELVPLSLESLRFNRDQFRRNVDYSVLVFIIFWGLNVVDAAVDAHLKGFDVSPDLSLRLKPGHSEMAGTNGLSIVLTFR